MTAAYQPSVSVIVAVRDAEATIDECLLSLLALHYPRDRLEIIVVDNASRDRTPEIVERYSGDVVLTHERRRGPAAARNAGIRKSAGQTIALTDADCSVDPGWLAALVAPLESAHVGIAGGAIRARRPATPIEIFGESIHDHRLAIEHWRPPYVITMNWAAPRAVLDELGPFDETLLRGSDIDFAYRAAQRGYAFAFCPDAVVYHRNESSLLGLAGEGWTHGFHGAEVRRRHGEYVARELGRCPGAPEDGPDEIAPWRFRATFELAKRAGRTAAALRFSLRALY